MDRIILHSDCNNFFASVETAQNPSLKGVPMAVAGDREARRGIILAKNELAKACGVKTAEPIWQALKKCPDLLLVPPRHHLYHEYSERINKIYAEYTDLVEKFSVDESWLDVTGSVRLFGDGKTIADTIRKRVKEEIGITVSVGVSFNKVFAKIGSDYKKPDATTVITRRNFHEILYPLPVCDMLFVGKNALLTLSKSGIKTIGDLAEADIDFLQKALGKTGPLLKQYALGEDDEPVASYDSEREVKSIGKGLTFSRNLKGEADIKKGIIPLSENVAAQLREKGLKCTSISVHIKDTELKTISRQLTLKKPTYLAKEIHDAAFGLVIENWNLSKPVRMLTVTVSGLVLADESEQISLLDETENCEKREKLELAIDKIRKTYGSASITSGGIIKNDLGIEYKD